ncbi:hypothetical protein HRbin27_01233 [bacterium HR27]|nr:hypothetical protein HRbin27_01233 [bacterium HR27]
MFEELEEYLTDALEVLAHVIFDVTGETRLRPASLPVLAGHFFVQADRYFLEIDQMSMEDPCTIAGNQTGTHRLEHLNHANQRPDDRSEVEIDFVPHPARHMIDLPDTGPATREECYPLPELVAMIAKERADPLDILVDRLTLRARQTELLLGPVEVAQQVLQADRVVIIRDMFLVDTQIETDDRPLITAQCTEPLDIASRNLHALPSPYPTNASAIVLVIQSSAVSSGPNKRSTM